MMDDEQVVRDVACELARALGHEVDFAENGEAAVNKYRVAAESGNPFDIVILDLVVRGGLGGKETLARLRAIDSGIKAIISSGYADSNAVADYKTNGFAGRLVKPYKLGDLNEALNALL